MSDADPGPAGPLTFEFVPELREATMVMAFSGWMDGGEVSTGSVQRLLELTDAQRFASIDPEPFYIYNFPGSMEMAALFRPHIEIREGLVRSLEMPTNHFYRHSAGNLAMLVGKEPNLKWRQFADCVLEVAHRIGVRRLLFVGSYGGSVPHTRQPRLYVTCSEPSLLEEMQRYGVARTGYEGPGSFVTYLMTRAPDARVEMVSLVVEIPSYLQGPNPACIEAAARRLAKMLKLPLDLDSLRSESTRWELEVSRLIEKDEELAAEIRKLEEAYDDELLEQEG